MVRLRVKVQKRLRVSMACNECKKKKQKCDGDTPCWNCKKRNCPCIYRDRDYTKAEQQLSLEPLAGNNKSVSPPPPVINSSFARPRSQRPRHIDLSAIGQINQQNLRLGILSDLNGLPKLVIRQHELNRIGFDASSESIDPGANLERVQRDSAEVSRQSGAVAPDHAFIPGSTRMLRNPSGKWLFIGDSATLAFLQLIRMIVEDVVGPCNFTRDPERHIIMEKPPARLPHNRRTLILADRQTCITIVEAYFTNTAGIIELFDRKVFMETLQSYHADHRTADEAWLCLLHLVLAIGLAMASPIPGTQEFTVIEDLRSGNGRRAEELYCDAKDLSDHAGGLESGEFWSIQALAMMSVYNLAVSRRNLASANHSMAVNTAFSLGLHQDETMHFCLSSELAVRKNVWRSLFILDRFINASLGRPILIREIDCSGSAIELEHSIHASQAEAQATDDDDEITINVKALEASVRGCRVLGNVLEAIYSKRKFSAHMAQEIADDCQDWPDTLDSCLRWRQLTMADPDQCIMVLHINLIYCHTMILMTRPFLLLLMNDPHRGNPNLQEGMRDAKFAETCVIISSQTIEVVQSAFESGHLPCRNPFILYFLFAACLVVLSNECFALFENANAKLLLDNAAIILNDCASKDPQTRHLLGIFTSFREIVHRQQLERDSDNALSNVSTRKLAMGPACQSSNILLRDSRVPAPQRSRCVVVPGPYHFSSELSADSRYLASSSSANFVNASSVVTNHFGNSFETYQNFTGMSNRDSPENNSPSRYPSGGDNEIDFEMLFSDNANIVATQQAHENRYPSSGGTGVGLSNSPTSSELTYTPPTENENDILLGMPSFEFENDHMNYELGELQS